MSYLGLVSVGGFKQPIGRFSQDHFLGKSEGCVAPQWVPSHARAVLGARSAFASQAVSRGVAGVSAESCLGRELHWDSDVGFPAP